MARVPTEGRLPLPSDGRRPVAPETEPGGTERGHNDMRQRLKSESGIALVMAVGILAVLMIAGASVIFYAGSNARSAEHSVDDSKALNLAEAGMNYARAILWKSSDPTSASAVPSGTLTLEGGTVAYSGTYDSASKIWTLTGSGTYTNPTGGTQPVSRTASSQVLVATTGGMEEAWGYLFADTTSMCTNLKNFIEIDAPIYVRGDLCMENQAVILSDLVQVRGKVDIKDSASIGTASEIVDDVAVGGGCRYPWSGTYISPCGTSQKVYRTNFSSSPPNILKPSVDLPYWYTNAKPGPTQGCTSGSFPGTFDNGGGLNRSNGTQYLFSSAYDCQVRDGSGNLLGRIAFTPGNPGTMIIEGVVFFDGKLELQGNNTVVYQGRGSIYATDEIKIQNFVSLCAVSGCTTSWDPDVALLALIGGATGDSGVLVENNTHFQGAIYVVNDYFQKNDVEVCGPVVAQELKIENGSENCYVPFDTAAPGMPGSTGATVVTLTNVDDSFTTD
jgi:Tfp pilus assembly protein PilX